ncbi:hypothetical protein [Mumia zhuanghuii]|nr:hypothetical protein [Mumia zhuanghuii]
MSTGREAIPMNSRARVGSTPRPGRDPAFKHLRRAGNPRNRTRSIAT